MTWLRQLLDWQREAADPAEFLDALRFDLSTQEVYVFTPKGDVIALPKDSTPVDFAYAVHTEVGHKCIGAQGQRQAGAAGVDAVQRRRDRDLHVEVGDGRARRRTGSASSSRPRARTKIRQHFNKERREGAIEQGKDAIAKAMRKQGLPLQRMMTADSLMAIARELHLADVVVALRGGRREPGLGAVRGGRGWSPASAGSRAPPRTSPRPRCRPAGPAAPQTSARPRCRGPRRDRHLDQAGPLLHSGAGRLDLRLHHPHRRGQRAPRRLHQRRRPAPAVRPDGRRWSGSRRRRRCSWSRSRSRRWTGTSCSPT